MCYAPRVPAFEELAVLLQRLRDEGDENKSEAQHRIPRELLFVEDAVKVPLRELAAESSQDALAAEYILWFLGDKSDVRAMHPKINGIGKPLVAAGVTRADLAESLGPFERR